MKRHFAVSVAGARLLVQVQPAGVDGFEVQVEGSAPVLVRRRSHAHGNGSQWLWQEGSAVVVADVDGSVGSELRVGLRGIQVPVKLDDSRKALLASLGIEAPRVAAGPVLVRSPMPGRVVKVLVKPGDRVVAEQAMLVVEAMKMENEMRAPRSSTVTSVAVTEGEAVEAGANLVVLEPLLSDDA